MAIKTFSFDLADAQAGRFPEGWQAESEAICQALEGKDWSSVEVTVSSAAAAKQIHDPSFVKVGVEKSDPSLNTNLLIEATAKGLSVAPPEVLEQLATEAGKKLDELLKTHGMGKIREVSCWSGSPDVEDFKRAVKGDRLLTSEERELYSLFKANQ